MKPFILLTSALLLVIGVRSQTPENALSAQEQAEGWQLLFNGKHLSGWEITRGSLPEEEWQVVRRELSIRPDVKSHREIISDKQYTDFGLRLAFKLTEGVNSGIKYFFTEDEEGGWLGPEFQIIDNDNRPVAKLGIDGN